MPNLLFHFNRYDTTANLREWRLIFAENGLEINRLNQLAEDLLAGGRKKNQKEWKAAQKKSDAVLAECKELLCRMKKNPDITKQELDTLEANMNDVERVLHNKTRARLRAIFPTW